MKRLPLSTAAALLVLLAVACSSDDDQPASTYSAAQAAAEGLPARPDRVPLVEGPVSPDGLKAILGTADLGVGLHRLGFVLTSPNGFVTVPVAAVSSKYFASPGSEGEMKQSVVAEYQPWPYGSRGLYAAGMDFDVAGRWGIDITVVGPDGTIRKTELLFDVAGAPFAPAVGSPAVRSVSKTVADVESLAQLTTGSLKDRDLYQTTIADAVISGKPTVVVFASPAFCTNAVCGPQVEVLQELKNKYKERVNFIHVDFYDNPEEIQGDLDKARLSPTVLEWRLPSIEWSFVIDSQGVVTARFEAFATFKEVEEALLRAL
jgi:peroxiredoxin